MTMFIKVHSARTGQPILLNAAAVEQFHPGRPKGAPEGTNSTAWFRREPADPDSMALEWFRETVEEIAALIAEVYGSRAGCA